MSELDTPPGDVHKGDGPHRSLRHPSYRDLPPVTEIGQQLRRIQALSKQFELHLGDALGCNPTDLAAMEYLIDKGPVSPTELADQLGITTAAATMVVDRLTKLGHVRRQSHETDRRRVVVVPSPDSIAAAVKVLLPVIEGVDQLIGQLDQRERNTVQRFLAGVIDVYGSAVDGSLAQRPTRPPQKGAARR